MPKASSVSWIWSETDIERVEVARSGSSDSASPWRAHTSSAACATPPSVRGAARAPPLTGLR